MMSTTRDAHSPSRLRLHEFLNPPAGVKVVDIGANPIDGPAPYAPLLAAGCARVVGFEPNLEALAKLNERKGPNETYLPYAIGDGSRHVLHHCQAPGMTSLLEPNPEILSLFHGFPDWGRVVRTEEVPTVRLDDVPETAGLNFLKIDIQGAELMVFENARERLSSALVIQTEVEFLPMYRRQPLFSEIEIFLRNHGFMLHRFDALVSRTVKPLLVNNDIYAGLGQLFWADAIFVKDMAKLDKLSAEQLLQYAIIMHDCYQSCDLALRALIEYDHRTRSNYARRLMEHSRVAAKPDRSIESKGQALLTKRNDPCPCGSGKRYKHCCGSYS